MSDREVPVVDYLGDSEVLNEERRHHFDEIPNQFIPELKIVKREDLGIQPGGQENGFYKRVHSLQNGYFLEFDFDVQERTRKFLKHHHLGRNLTHGRMIALGAAERINLRERNVRFATLKLKHPFILEPMYFIGPSEHIIEATSILYEDAPLGNLHKYIKLDEEEVDDTTALEWAYQLAAALVYCHDEQKILHRAITPKSIFLFQDPTSDNLNVKLGGFTFARLPAEGPLTANANPDLCFSAPETLNERNCPHARYDYSSDVWSFAIVLHFITHQGQDPYPDRLKTRKALKKALLKTEDNPEPIRPALREDLHHHMKALIDACLRSELRDEQGNIETIEPIRPTAAQIKRYLERAGYGRRFSF